MTTRRFFGSSAWPTPNLLPVKNIESSPSLSSRARDAPPADLFALDLFERREGFTPLMIAVIGRQRFADGVEQATELAVGQSLQ